MAFDGGFTGRTAEELGMAVDCHIDKIYQPSENEIYLTFRKKGFVKKVLLSAKSGMARVQFTDAKPENPEKPPMFCMLMRKHFSSAKLKSVSQKGFERIIEFTFEATNELGDRVDLKIICELIGNMSNIIMLDREGRIIDAIKRSEISENKRLIAPGARYEYPEEQEKYNILLTDTEFLCEKILGKGEMVLSKAIMDTVGGISPVVAREILFKAGLTDVPVEELHSAVTLNAQLERLKQTAVSGGTPFMLLKDGVPFDFSYTDISQYGNLCQKETFNSYGELLDAFYLIREREAVKKRLTGEVTKLVSNLIARAQKRAFLRENELKSCENRENLRIYGELLKANIGRIKTGQTSVKVQNFYDENLSEIEIELNPALNPQGNAARYFKEYKKKSTAANTLLEFIENDKKEIEYLETVKESLSRCETTADLREIKQELALSGYIKRPQNAKSYKPVASKFTEYKSVEGYRIIVGKNNVQNDLITTKLASKLDVWFHTKNIHGSHVVVFSGGKEISDETVLFAAGLAAANSKAKESSNVPVDYTQVKNVKKPSGAKPGMVIYKSNNTVFVTPYKEN